jgi:hypothetical protein
MEYSLADSNMMEFQASPVEHLRRVKKDVPKD